MSSSAEKYANAGIPAMLASRLAKLTFQPGLKSVLDTLRAVDPDKRICGTRRAFTEAYISYAVEPGVVHEALTQYYGPRTRMAYNGCTIAVYNGQSSTLMSNCPMLNLSIAMVRPRGRR